MDEDEKKLLEIADLKQARKMDETCCKLVGAKQALACLLRETAEEYKEAALDDIATRYIEKSPEINSVPVDQDKRDETEQLLYDAVSDKTLTEGNVHFDILFSAWTPKGDGACEMFVNIENQTQWNPGYPLIKRAVYYVARLVSQQKGRVFIKSDYGKIRKVYSYWICMDPPEAYRNTVTRYTFQPEHIIGDAPFERQEYDLITVVMICLGKPEELREEKDILRFLQVLLSMDMPIEERKDILESEYNVKMSQEMEQEVEEMCSIGEMIAVKNLQQGITKGSTMKGDNVALLMMEDGEPMAKIMRYTDYSADRLHELAKSHGMRLVE